MIDYFPTLRELAVIRQYDLDEDECIDLLFKKQYGHLTNCPKCGRKAKFYRVQARKCYQTGSCGHSVSPTAGTIFEKTNIPLRVWFEAIHLIYASGGKIPCMELQRVLERDFLHVKYPTAWRMKDLVCRYLGFKKSYDYEHTSAINGRYRQPDYKAKHNL